MALDTPETLSAVVGWAYMVSWTVSFYPQFLLNVRRRTTHGVSIDYAILNITGMVCYAVHNVVLLCSPLVRRQYARRHPGNPMPAVRPNDVAYAVHGAVISLLIYSQFWPRLWRFTPNGNAKSSPWALYLVWASSAAIVVGALAVAAAPASPRWEWLDVMYLLGNVKAFLTLVKYAPQAWLNFRRQSTQGLSVVPFTLDLTGALLSLLQLAIDSAAQTGDLSAVWGNPAKLALANVTILFDLVFFVQVLYLYRDAPAVVKAEAEVDETGPLLASYRADQDRP